MTRSKAQAALELYAAAGSGDSWVQAPLPSSLSDRDRAEIADGCYTLLLVMAAAEPTPEAGMRRLDQAARSRPPTRAYHLRRAACLDRAGNPAAAMQERHRADQLQPTSGFDQFLVGQEAYERGDSIGALWHFDKAIQLERDQFWAHALSALCWLKLKGPCRPRPA